MAKTKITPGQSRRCPMCTFVARSEEEYKKHVVQCAMRTFNCTYCSYTSNKEINVKRHERRSHLGLIEEPVKLDGRKDNVKELTTSSTSSSKSMEAKDAEQSDEEWLKQDYGDIIGDVSADSSDISEEEEEKIEPIEQEKTSAKDSLLEGRVIRKQTTTAKPYAPKTKNPISTGKPEAISNVTECESCKRKRPMVDVAVQTDRSQKTVITRQVKRFREGDIDIEEVREEKIES